MREWRWFMGTVGVVMLFFWALAHTLPDAFGWVPLAGYALTIVTVGLLSQVLRRSIVRRTGHLEAPIRHAGATPVQRVASITAVLLACTGALVINGDGNGTQSVGLAAIGLTCLVAALALGTWHWVQYARSAAAIA